MVPRVRRPGSGVGCIAGILRTSGRINEGRGLDYCSTEGLDTRDPPEPVCGGARSGRPRQHAQPPEIPETRNRGRSLYLPREPTRREVPARAANGSGSLIRCKINAPLHASTMRPAPRPTPRLLDPSCLRGPLTRGPLRGSAPGDPRQSG